jgi:sugar phosphate isomerase/epimerase
MENDEVFHEARTKIMNAKLPCPIANCFIPGSLKITGNNVKITELEAYVSRAISRASIVGIDMIVFGSGGARRVPEGFSHETAWNQLLDFGRMVGQIAQKYDVVVVVEPLNHKECNILTSVGEAGKYVEAVDHTYIRLLVDAYHWAVDNDSYDDIVNYGHLIHHTHIATPLSRRPPGLEQHNFTSFFEALSAIKYDGRISIEARWEDVTSEAAGAYKTLKSLAEKG